MNEVVSMVLSFVPALAAGVVLGAIFFGGLWWTTKKAVLSKTPGFWFIVSMVARTAVALTGFYFVALGSWEKFLICLLGFIIARVIVTHLASPPESSGRSPSNEAGNAS